MSEKVIIFTIDDISQVNLTQRPLILDDDLGEAVLISLFTDRQAAVTDELPPGSANRRGWWADCLDNKNEKIGCRQWLLTGTYIIYRTLCWRGFCFPK